MEQTCNANKGDLIEIFRGSYQHWAVYIGDQEVVHLVNEGDESPGPFESLSSSSSSRAEVKLEKLADVVGSDCYQVNNQLDEKYEARDPSIIVKEAREMVGREPQYDVVSNNCEHSANEMRYGVAESRQVFKAVIRGAALGAGALVAGDPVIAVAAAIGGEFAFCRALLSIRSSSVRGRGREQEENKNKSQTLATMNVGM